MRILILASVLGILASVAVLMVVIIKANRGKENAARKGEPPSLDR